MKFLKNLLGLLVSNERRRAERKLSPPLTAYYWTGGAPQEHNIRDISSTGLFLITDERWYPGTILAMTLQKKNAAHTNPPHSISVQSKAVRSEEDGVGLEFVMPEIGDAQRSYSVLPDGADRKSLDKFLNDLDVDSTYAIVHGVINQ